MKRKFQSPFLYIMAVIIGTLIFAGGFLVTNQIIYSRDATVLATIIDNFYSIFESGVGINLLDGDICSAVFSEKLESEFYLHRRLIADLEDALGKDNSRVILQKKVYTIAQAQHLTIKEAQKEKCGLTDIIILFFYSNSESWVDESERVGSILDSVAYQNKNLVIYSFDVDVNSSIIRGLVEKYNIRQIPSIVIDGESFGSPESANEFKKEYLTNLTLVLN